MLFYWKKEGWNGVGVSVPQGYGNKGPQPEGLKQQKSIFGSWRLEIKLSEGDIFF